jgi:AraC-like DNA-binding protein
MHVSRRTLYAAFPAEGGVAAEIRRQRRLRAHRLLLSPGRAPSIGQIAAQVGLPNVAHFSRIFRAYYGMTPSDVRARRRSSPHAGVTVYQRELQEHQLDRSLVLASTSP